jgi:glucan biosynthesis protein C
MAKRVTFSDSASGTKVVSESCPLPATADIQPKATTRLYFIDNIRVYLTILVLLHHMMITYAGTGLWYYNEGRQDLITRMFGAWFCSTNQAYFMGLFLLISAYFVPGSYDRKGAGPFLKDRLIRLGIPLALFSWVINPLFVYAFFYRDIRMPFWHYFPGKYFKHGPLIGAGPLWFVEALLIFSFAYMLWRFLNRHSPADPVVETRFPGNSIIALFALLLGIAGFMVRLWHPVGWNFGPLNFQFPFFAQYVALFVVGLIAYRRNWLLALPDKTGRFWSGIAILLILLWLPLIATGGANTDNTPFRGGWHWQSLAFALWESFLCLSMCIGLIYIFRHFFNSQRRLVKLLVPNAYTAYIIHAPVITVLAFTVRDVTLYPLLKWVVLSMIAVPICFALSALVRKLPYADRVL